MIAQKQRLKNVNLVYSNHFVQITDLTYQKKLPHACLITAEIHQITLHSDGYYHRLQSLKHVPDTDSEPASSVRIQKSMF